MEENLGQRVHIARTRLNIKQKELAQRVGISAESLSRIEKEKIDIDHLRLKTLRGLAKELEMSLDELVYGKTK